MPVPFIMPKVDMDQEKATIISWEKQDGDQIKRDETVLVVETDKVAIDVPAPDSGTLAGIRYQEGDVVPVTEVIAYVLKDGETLEDVLSEVEPESQPAVPAPPEPAAVKPASSTPIAFSATPVAARIAEEHHLDLSQVPSEGERIKRQDVERYLAGQQQAGGGKEAQPPGKIAATPAARRLAREAGIPLESLTGSGPRGRIQAEDVKTIPQQPTVAKGDREAVIIPLEGMREKIAERMQASFHDSPHIALTVEADMTRLEIARKRMNEIAAQRGAGKVSLTALLVKVIAWTLERNPYINASLEDGQIYQWKDINIGVATALEEGLIVPVIQQANLLSVRQIAEVLTDLSTRARKNRLTLADVNRGTFTISNLGMFNIQQFRAVINPPESAILALGTVVRKPVVVDDQDTVAVRPMMSITISADHRVIDGIVAARFLNDLLIAIETPETLLY